MRQLILREEFTNIQNAQAGLTKLFEKASQNETFYRVMRNDKPVGILMPINVWEEFLEDMEALASPNYLKTIARARKQVKKGSLRSLEEVAQEFGLA